MFESQTRVVFGREKPLLALSSLLTPPGSVCLCSWVDGWGDLMQDEQRLGLPERRLHQLGVDGDGPGEELDATAGGVGRQHELEA